MIHVWRYDLDAPRGPGGKRKPVIALWSSPDVAARIAAGAYGDGRYRLEHRDAKGVLVRVEMVLVGEQARQHRMRPRPAGIAFPAPVALPALEASVARDRGPGAPQRVAPLASNPQRALPRLSAVSGASVPVTPSARPAPAPSSSSGPINRAVMPRRPQQPPKHDDPLQDAMQQVSYWCDLRVWSKQEGESAETLRRIDQWIAYERGRIDECERLYSPRRAR